MDPKEKARLAYATARTALKEAGRSDEEIETDLKDLGEKCGYDAGVQAVAMYMPFGGATSFAELDEYQRGQIQRQSYDQLNWQLRSLMNNVLDNPELSDQASKAGAIASLANEFASRADAVPSAVAAVTEQEMITDVRDTRAGQTWIDRLLGRKSKEAVRAPTIDAGSFTSMKDTAGNWRWLAVYSNRYYDREGEVFPEQAHKDFLAWADASPEDRYPELWDWHTPVGIGVVGDKGLGMGRADFLDYQDGLAIAGGYWYPEFAHVADTYSGRKDMGISHGYDYAPWALNRGDKSYAHYFTFEISPLPRARAANDFTLFLPDAGSKEAIMKLRPDRRAHLVEIHGKDYVDTLETNLGAVADKLQASGISFKDLDEAFVAVPPTNVPSAAGTPAAPGISVPPAAAAADGSIPGDSAPLTLEGLTSALKESLAPAMGAAIAGALGPVTQRLDALETAHKEMLQAQKDQHLPRVTIDLTNSPSNNPNNVVNGNTPGLAAAVRAANAGAKDYVPPAQQDDGSDPMAWYRNNGLFGAGGADVAAAVRGAGGFGDDFVTAAIAAAGQPVAS